MEHLYVISTLKVNVRGIIMFSEWLYRWLFPVWIVQLRVKTLMNHHQWSCDGFTPQPQHTLYFKEQTEPTHTHTHTLQEGLPSSCVRCGCRWTPQCVHCSRRPPQTSCRRPCPRKAGCPRWPWCPLGAGWSPGRRSCRRSAAAGGRIKKGERAINSTINTF